MTARLLRQGLVLASLFSAPLAAQAPAPAAADHAALLQRIAGELDRLQARSSSLRALPFTPQDVVAAGRRTPAELGAFVRERTRWVPYLGCLRGARGVLADGTGNSLDRALLLAELLRCAGHQARLARATLPAALADERLRTELQRPAAADELPPSYDRADEDALALVAAAAASLLPALPPGTDAAPDLQSAVAAAQDHFWVQWQDGGAFVDLDPSTADGRPPVPATATIAATADGFALPAELFHVVRLRLVVEAVTGGKRTETVALRADLRPADRTAESVELSFHHPSWPSGVGITGAAAERAAFRQALLAQKEWLPVLQLGKERVAKASFDHTGKVDEHPLLDGRGKLGAAAKRGFDAFGGGDDEPAGLLTALWIEFELVGPGLTPLLRRHELFDLLGPAARAAGQLPTALTEAQRLDRAQALLAATHVLTLGGHLAGGLLARQGIEAMVAMRGAARDLQRIDDPARRRAAYEDLAATALPPKPELAFAALRAGLGALGSAEARVFLARANLVCARTRTHWDGNGEVRTQALLDVVQNEVAVRPDLPPRPERLRQGIVDTVAEALALGQVPAAGANTLGLGARLQARGGTFATVAAADQLAALASSWPADVRARAAADLAGGAVLLATATPLPVDGRDRLGWWRLDPGTGTAIGVMDTGFHQGDTEYTETTSISTPLQRARRLLEFLAKPGNRNLIYRARNGSRIVGDMATEWAEIEAIQARAAAALYEGFGVIL